jgi:hypothetical protein
MQPGMTDMLPGKHEGVCMLVWEKSFACHRVCSSSLRCSACAEIAVNSPFAIKGTRYGMSDSRARRAALHASTRLSKLRSLAPLIELLSVSVITWLQQEGSLHDHGNCHS